MALGFGANCAKVILLIVNIIFLVTGLAVLGVGVWLTVDENILKVVDFVVTDQSTLFRGTAILLIVIGSIVVVVSILGFVGAIIEHRILLTIYIALVLVVFAAELAGGIAAIVYKDEIVMRVDDSLKKSIQEVTSWSYPYYNRTNNNTCMASGEGQLWDFVQVKFNCCGIYDHPNSGYLTHNNFSQFCPSLELPYPVTCCLHKNADVGDLSGERDQKYLKEMFDCKGGFKEKGCSDALVDWVEKYAPVLIGMGIGVGMFELLVVLFALCLCQHVTYKDM